MVVYIFNIKSVVYLREGVQEFIIV